MRGADQRNDTLFSYVRPDSRIPPNHPLRPIRRITDIALKSLSDRFDAMYSEIGRPSIPPEKLLRALLLQAFYSIRSERQLMEQMDYNLLFRWFVGLSVDDPASDYADRFGGCCREGGYSIRSDGTYHPGKAKTYGARAPHPWSGGSYRARAR